MTNIVNIRENFASHSRSFSNYPENSAAYTEPLYQTTGHKLMVQQPVICDDYWVPDASSLVTEDDTPVDNFASAKQQRLLVSSLYSCAREQTFLAERL